MFTALKRLSVFAAFFSSVVYASPGVWPAVVGGIPTIQTFANQLCFQSGQCVSTGGGTVSSVALTVPSWLSVSGSPVTSSGTLAVTGTSQAQNLFLASPNGSSGPLSPRAIVAADVPTLNQNTTGTAGGLSATLGANFGGAAPVTNDLYIDQNRIDSYTATGSQAKPFLTISAALTAMGTAANSTQFQAATGTRWNLHIAPGIYTENLTVPLWQVITFNVQGVQIVGNVTWNYDGNKIVGPIDAPKVIFAGTDLRSGYNDGEYPLSAIVGNVTINNTSNAFAMPNFYLLNYSVVGNITTSTTGGGQYLAQIMGQNFALSGNVITTNTTGNSANGITGLFYWNSNSDTSYTAGGAIGTGNVPGFIYLNHLDGVTFTNPVKVNTAQGGNWHHTAFAAGSDFTGESGVYSTDSSSYASYKANVTAGSETFTFLDNASGVKYTPTTSGNWPSVPGTDLAALDNLASTRVLRTGDTMTGALVVNSTAGVTINNSSAQPSALYVKQTGSLGTGVRLGNSGNSDVWYLDTAFPASGAFSLVQGGSNQSMSITENLRFMGFFPSAKGGGAEYPFQVRYGNVASTQVTSLASLTPNSNTYDAPTVHVQNANTTVDTLTGFTTSGSSDNVMSFAGSINHVQTAASEQAEYIIATANAGVVTEGFRLTDTQQLQFKGYGAGVLKTDGSGNVTAGTVATSNLANADTVYLSMATGALSSPSFGSETVISAGKTPRAITLENIEAVASTFTVCGTNPVVTLYDCGTSAGTCLSGQTAKASVTVTAGATITDGSVSSANIAAGHYWAMTLTAGACTALNLSATAEAIMQ